VDLRPQSPHVPLCAEVTEHKAGYSPGMSQRDHNVTARVDSNLRDVAVAPDEMRSAVAQAREQLAEEVDPRKRIVLLGRIGVYSRILCDLAAAQAALSEAVEVERTLGDPELETVNSIRLAHSFHWSADFARANALLESALERCRQDPRLHKWTDLAFQHRGKCQLDEGRVHEAIQSFEEALQLRLDKGDEELIESTRGALALARRRAAAR